MSATAFLAEPPEGVSRDVDGQTLVQQRIIVDASLTLSISLFILACRLYSRLFVTRSMGLDDYAIIVAMFFAVVFFVCCLSEMGYGLGKHYWDVPLEHEVKYMTLMIPFEISNFWCPMMTKCSLLISFHRLSSAWYFRFFIYTLASIIAAYTIIITIIVPAECIKPTAINDTCIYTVTLWQSVLNISTNTIVLFLPIPSLWKMQLPFSQKFGAAVIFSMGILVVVASIVRVKYILAYAGQLDFTYYQAATINLGAAELNCGIMCSCLAVMKPFILYLFPALNPTPKIDNSTAPSDDRRGFKKFVKERTGMSYQLGHLGHKDLPDDKLTDTVGKSGIVVTNSYHVDFDEEARDSRSESMENIIPSRMKGW